MSSVTNDNDDITNESEDNHIKNSAVFNILKITSDIATLEKEIHDQYEEMVKTILKKSVHKVDNNVIKILLHVCGCKNDILHIQNR